MAARPAALMRRFFGAALVPVTFAHRIFRAFARALISFRRCAADRRRLVRLTGTGVSAGLAASALDSPAMAFELSFQRLDLRLERDDAPQVGHGKIRKRLHLEKDACGFARVKHWFC